MTLSDWGVDRMEPLILINSQNSSLSHKGQIFIDSCKFKRVDLVFGELINGAPTFATRRVFGFELIVAYDTDFDKTFDTRFTALVEVQEPTKAVLNLKGKRVYFSSCIHLDIAQSPAGRRNLSNNIDPMYVSGFNVSTTEENQVYVNDNVIEFDVTSR